MLALKSMRTHRDGYLTAWLLTALLVWPIASLAAHPRCVAAAHPCASTPALLACCCTSISDAEQPLATARTVAVQAPAAGGEVIRLIATPPPRVAFARLAVPASSPPTDRLALFRPLLI